MIWQDLKLSLTIWNNPARYWTNQSLVNPAVVWINYLSHIETPDRLRAIYDRH